MSDVFLGIIAVSVLVMAAVQVAAIVMALRAARRVSRLTSQIEQEIRPVVANLQAITADAARATAIAAAQVERADRLFTDMAGARRRNAREPCRSRCSGPPAGAGRGWPGSRRRSALCAICANPRAPGPPPSRKKTRFSSVDGRITAARVALVSSLDPTPFPLPAPSFP